MAETRAPVARPLSPHIQIYKFMLTFVMSGFHRVTGLVLYFGIVLLVWWLLAAASGPNAYAWVQWFYGTWIGRLVLLGFMWGLSTTRSAASGISSGTRCTASARASASGSPGRRSRARSA